MIPIIVAGVVAFIVSIFLTPVLIRRFSDNGMGQEIRAEGPRSHLRKRGTPTMGGIAIIVAILVGYIIAHLAAFTTGEFYWPSVSGLIVLGLMLGMGLLGFLDDYIKLAKGRNLGLNKKGKLIGQALLALLFGAACLVFPNEFGLRPASTHLSFLRDIDEIDLAIGGGIIGTIVFLAFIYFVVTAWSNAVNLTDGLDGLAAGTGGIVFGAYVLMTFWQFRNSCSVSTVPGCYMVRDPLDLAVISSCGVGACLGFLWWNAAPAKIFMGDTGSLALGGLVAGISITSRTELLMVVIGALFVAETISVVIQVAVFKITGKRFFRMAPFHHHFENGGWAEITVVIRFWLLTSMFAALGAAMFYAEWLGGR